MRATISDDGSCACGILSDAADWDAESWEMRDEMVEPLASTLECLMDQGPRTLVIEALWAGECATRELHVDSDELARLVRSCGLGTKTRYVVSRRTV